MSEIVQVTRTRVPLGWILVATVTIALALVGMSGWFVVVGPVGFYDANFEVFGIGEPLTSERRESLLAAHRSQLGFLFFVMLLSNLCLLGACAILFLKSRR